MRQQTIDSVTLSFGTRRIDVMIGSDCSAEFVDAILELGPDRVAIVTDDTVLAHAGHVVNAFRERVQTLVLSAPAGESMKSVAMLGAHLDAAIREGLTKKSVIVALGGGVPGNLAGMVAALLYRGIPLVHIPTNLTSATDSVLSLKQAVNSSCGKNQIGTYHEPTAIFVDLQILASQSTREVRAGACEALKNALAIVPDQLILFGDGQLPESRDDFRRMLESCIRAKSEVMKDDPLEQREALVLEYGHTVGHSIELCEKAIRGAGALSHGECIALGMVVAARVSRTLGYLDDEAVRLHERLIRSLGAPLTLPSDIAVDTVLSSVLHDNKRGIIAASEEHVPMVLLEAIGRPLVTEGYPLFPVPLDTLRRVLQDLSVSDRGGLT